MSLGIKKQLMEGMFEKYEGYIKKKNIFPRSMPSGNLTFLGEIFLHNFLEIV